MIVSTTPYQLSAKQPVIEIDCTDSDVTILLPRANYIYDISKKEGATFTFKKIDTTNNLAIIKAAGNETIDGDKSVELQSRYTSITLYSNGINWLII
jgi:hypothetical protein